MKNINFKLIAEMMDEKTKPELSMEEKAFRRGFTHGVLAVHRHNISIQEAYEWRHSADLTCPPGICMAGESL